MSASNRRGHGIHSPFVYDFVVKVLSDPFSERKNYDDIERIRKDFKSSGKKIPILDLGAGSYKNKSPERKVSSIVQSAAKPARFGRFFYRMVRYYGIESVLELGTSLGMSTRYFAKGMPHGIVHSIEGAPELAEFTQTQLAKEGFGNITVTQGEFSEVLPDVLTKMRGRKIIYIDGNHRYAPTISYFHEVLKSIGNDDILVFDDIHWSQEMEKAWKEIKNNEQVSCIIDLFFIGIVFFRKEFKEKCSFSFRF